ncbi:hypothetical protein Pla8534_70320 [Lignipirellula cremea]|uniref:Uncharacterized protein n=1 Tax=Lignipirellula cremea TaxID=2528010 RepID=A0A518E4U3_9BACT|nr:hypothetical protein Pla8534_70320 [Lignipirellula cremea]
MRNRIMFENDQILIGREPQTLVAVEDSNPTQILDIAVDVDQQICRFVFF